MSKPIINLDELEYAEFGKGDKFNASRGAISPHAELCRIAKPGQAWRMQLVRRVLGRFRRAPKGTRQTRWRGPWRCMGPGGPRPTAIRRGLFDGTTDDRVAEGTHGHG